ncbi:hypothetical protein F4778DRAFT_265583 [Xylariomycetidae sp. FL2044]|nr:hypothetical protein F4778DRAFT_265583 [Xylariomycetidae sp. FL2044]
MSPQLRPFRLPLLIEERKRMEEAAQCDADAETAYSFYNSDSFSSDATSPSTPTFSPRGHLRYSSSLSSFDLTTPATSEGPSSPTQTIPPSGGKRILADVVEEPIESDKSEDDKVHYGAYDDDDDSDLFGLYDCLCDEPCIHRDHDLVHSISGFYTQRGDVEYDAGFLSDGDFDTSSRSSKKRRETSGAPFMGFTHRFHSRFPSLAKWKASKQTSGIGSPVSDFGFEKRPTLSRAASSRSSSISASGRYPHDRSNEPPLPPTPALSYYESSDSITLPGPLDVEKANSVLVSIERERAQATTPLLPPMMASASTDESAALPSPLESPTIVSSVPTEPQSPLVLSPPLSSKTSIASFRNITLSAELPPIPAPDAWSDRLGHANFTIIPKPYRPDVATLSSLRQLRTDWETARINYTKHLVRTGEHYGLTSKTYALTEAKWAETERNWRSMHGEIAETVVANGEAPTCEKFDEGVLTTVPIIDAEGKFPERGDEDIVGPMVREATMLPLDGQDRKRPGFWRNLTGRVGLRK